MAQNKITGELAAVKFIEKTKAMDEEAEEKMYNEIGILTTIDHPNVSYFHGFIEEPTKFILITELC